MARKSKNEAILAALEADPAADLPGLREIARNVARVLWCAHNGTVEETENEAVALAELIAVYASR